MNELQKKITIIGSTAFIVWFFLAIGNKAFISLFEGDFVYFVERAIYHRNPDWNANWFNALTFITWVGSAIAFNIYKEDK